MIIEIVDKDLERVAKLLWEELEIEKMKYRI